jgi:hypothetical protein
MVLLPAPSSAPSLFCAPSDPPPPAAGGASRASTPRPDAPPSPVAASDAAPSPARRALSPARRALERAATAAALLDGLGDPRLRGRVRLGSWLAEQLAQRQREARLATGLADVDRLLGGGFPRGCLSEITGAPSSGRTSLALTLATAATRAGEVAAWIDTADALDPTSLEAAGVDLGRLLWVRAPGARDALRCTERLLEAGGFALVVLDLQRPSDAERDPRARRDAGRPRRQPAPAIVTDPPEAAARLPYPSGARSATSATWLRLTHCASASGTALVLMGERPLVGPFATLVVDLRAIRLRFASRPEWLEGLETRVALARHRFGPTEGFAPVCWKVPPVEASPGEAPPRACDDFEPRPRVRDGSGA